VADTRSLRYNTIKKKLMPRVTNEDYQVLKDELEVTEEMRVQNYEAVVRLLAENRILKIILTGLSMKPIEGILQEARPMIFYEYHSLLLRYEEVDQMIEERNEMYLG